MAIKPPIGQLPNAQHIRKLGSSLEIAGQGQSVRKQSKEKVRQNQNAFQLLKFYTLIYVIIFLTNMFHAFSAIPRSVPILFALLTSKAISDKICVFGFLAA